MIQFKPYNIFINYNDLAEAEIKKARDIAVDSQRWDVMNQIDGPGAQVYDTEENTGFQSTTSKKYESSVKQQLEMICPVPMGKLLFDTLNPKVKIWILPKKADRTRNPSEYTASTFPGDPSVIGESVLIYYDPDEAIAKAPAADILFHELVHAYRMARVGYDPSPRSLLVFGGDYEEFFAFILQNIYLASMGSQVFRYSYSQNYNWVSAAIAYQSISGDQTALKALSSFNDDEWVFISRFSLWKNLLYNPFRDFKSLRQQSFRYQMW